MRMAKYCLMALAAMVCAVSLHAGDLDTRTLTIETGGNTHGKATNTVIRGYVHEIRIDMPAGATGTYSVVFSPESGLTDVDLATNNTATADQTFRPRYDGTEIGGDPLTSDPPWRYAVINGNVIFSVTNASATNLTHKAEIIFER